MKKDDRTAIHQLLKQLHIPTIETSEDVLKHLKPKRQYLGPGFWLREIQLRKSQKDE